MRRIGQVSRGLALGMFLALAGSSASPAQTPPATAAPLLTLKEALAKTDWNAEAQGPLLVILYDGNSVFPPSLRFTGSASIGTTAPRPTPKNGRFRLAQWEAYFDRKTLRAGGMSVFAPATMRVVNYRTLPPPDPYAGVAFAGRLQLLAASFSPAQWRLAGGAEGIGANDLTPQQREMFAALMPPTAGIVTQTQENSATQDARFESAPLTPAQRSGARLRISRRLDWTYQVGKTGGMKTYVSQAGTVTYGAGEVSPFEQRNAVYGVKLAEDIPNRLKPGELDFAAAALDPRISLDGAATIGDIIDRVRSATRLEIYADARYRLFPVQTRGASARAGDALKALALGLTGTFRRVGPALLLTDDVAGLGTRIVALSEWVALNRAAAMERYNQAARKLRDGNVAQYIPYPSDPANAPSDALKKKIEDFYAGRVAPEKDADGETPPNFGALRVPVKELPPTAQEMVQRELESNDRGDPNEAQKPEDQRVHRDFVRLTVTSHVELIFPGVGPAALTGLYAPPDLLHPRVIGEPPVTRPVAPAPKPLIVAKDKLPVRALLIRPESAEDAPKAAKAAAERGLTELWAEVGPEDAALTDAVIAAAHDNKLKARVVVRLLRPGKAANLPPDITIRGMTSGEAANNAAPLVLETARWNFQNGNGDIAAELRRQRRMGDWASLDAPAVREYLRGKLIALAQRPGLDGLVLRDAEPPGYNIYASFDREPPNSPSEQLGFGEAARLAFLRENSIDPVDLNPVNPGSLMPFIEGHENPHLFPPDVVPPYLAPPQNEDDPFTPPTKNPDAATRAKEASKRWGVFRADRAAAFRDKLTADLKAALPKTPLLLMEGLDFPRDYLYQWVASIEPERRAIVEAAWRNGEQYTGGTFADSLHRMAKTVLLCLSYYPTRESADYKTDFLRQQYDARKRLEGMDGIVLDFSPVGVPTALSALAALEIKNSEDSPAKAPLK